jgi:hypothetical protein
MHSLKNKFVENVFGKPEVKRPGLDGRTMLAWIRRRSA